MKTFKVIISALFLAAFFCFVCWATWKGMRHPFITFKP